MRAGSLEGGLRYYVGAANLPYDGGYLPRCWPRHFRLRQVAGRPAVATPVLSTPAPRRPPRSPQQPSLPKKSVLLDKRRLNDRRRWREAPSATLAGHATGDRRGPQPR